MRVDAGLVRCNSCVCLLQSLSMKELHKWIVVINYYHECLTSPYLFQSLSLSNLSFSRYSYLFLNSSIIPRETPSPCHHYHLLVFNFPFLVASSVVCAITFFPESTKKKNLKEVRKEKKIRISPQIVLRRLYTERGYP